MFLRMIRAEVTMRTLQRAFIVAFSLSAFAAYAQTTAGDATRGNTPPGMSQDGSRPADGAIKGGSIVPGEKAGIPDQSPAAGSTERVNRCNELSGLLREQCLDKERSAAGGSSAPRPRNKEAPIEREQDKLAPD
jgi:hypothetical protein